MNDKDNPEMTPNPDISIGVCLTPTDIPLCFLEGLTAAQMPENAPETLHKIGLSVRIEVLSERSAAPCRE